MKNTKKMKQVEHWARQKGNYLIGLCMDGFQPEITLATQTEVLTGYDKPGEFEIEIITE